MTGIELYSTTAANNNSAVPNGWPEGMAPSGVNDAARQMMAAIRTWYQDAEWTLWGDTTVYASGTSFTIAGVDVTSRYKIGRRVRAVGSSTGTIYGKISASAFATNTTVTVVWDSGSLSNETLTISLGTISGSATGALSANARAIDFDMTTLHGTDVASAATINLNAATGNIVDVTGTTGITAITLSEGRMRLVRFTGILTISNGASLVLPGAADITTAAGDAALFVGYASGVVRCFFYTRAASMYQPLDADLTTLSTAFTTASASSAASLAFAEDTDNGSNKVTVIAPAAVTSDRTMTLPDATDTFVGKATTDTLTNKTIATGSGNDVSQQFKVTNTTYDVATASGTVDLTGFGFNPRGVEIIMGVAGGGAFHSHGFADASVQGCNYVNGAGTILVTTGITVVAQTTAGVTQATGVISFITDGIRFTWTKVGSPTGTITMIIKGWR